MDFMESVIDCRNSYLILLVKSLNDKEILRE